VISDVVVVIVFVAMMFWWAPIRVSLAEPALSCCVVNFVVHFVQVNETW